MKKSFVQIKEILWLIWLNELPWINTRNKTLTDDKNGSLFNFHQRPTYLFSSHSRTDFPGRLLGDDWCRSNNLGPIYSPASLSLSSAVQSCVPGGAAGDREAQIPDYESWSKERIWSVKPLTNIGSGTGFVGRLFFLCQQCVSWINVLAPFRSLFNDTIRLLF